MRDAQRFRHVRGIPYLVAADNVEGTVHQQYGTLADPSYLIDSDGRVAFYNMWTYAPRLHQAIEALMAQGGRGVVLGGIDRGVYPLPALVDGWIGIRHGLPQSELDLELAAPGLGLSLWLGDKLRPLVAPLILRAKPLPTVVKLALYITGVALVVAALRQRD
jgi:hypothetical protein